MQSLNRDNRSIKILSDIVHHMKYAKFLREKNRRETFEETVLRNCSMHSEKFPELKDEIEHTYSYVLSKKVLPSMRSMQFAGKAIEINNTRLYNCSYIPIDSLDAFHEIMFLLLSGTGVGISVQKHHIKKLPPLNGPEVAEDSEKKPRRYLIGDSLEGWADAIKILFKTYFYNGREIIFDYRDIRPKGTPLKTSGGKAPGPQPLKDCIHTISKVLTSAIEERGRGTKLQPIEAHDIVCHIADAVLAGGIRRAALISGFSIDDEKMLYAKSGPWWELNPQRGRANNSVILLRDRVTHADFLKVWEVLKESNSGEPGFYFSNDKEWFANPCCEISLKPFQMCNLTEVNASTVKDQQDLNDRVKAAAFIGTLQASYTDFHYLRDIWQQTVEKDALLGVSLTGIASGALDKLDVALAAKIAIEENLRVAKIIGIRPASRITTIKPSGTSSLILGTSSGIHPWHSKYYLRRIRIGKSEALYNFLNTYHSEIIEDEFFNPAEQAVITIPVKAPENAITREESSLTLLKRVKYFFHNWIKKGYISGANQHNISVTVSVKDNEWDGVCKWMWENRDSYNGITLFPYDNHTYKQAPFEEISENLYNELISELESVDLTKVIEHNDNTARQNESACAGGLCEVI
jgi:ribonucleoside-triphosphate reductase